MPENKQTDVTMLIRTSANIRANFKAAAALKGKSMQQAINEFMEDFTQEVESEYKHARMDQTSQASAS